MQIASAYNVNLRPLGIFINDALGNAFENTPGVASNRGPYLCGSGTTVGLSIWETQVQVGASTALTYTVGDKVFASVNGLLTNKIEDAYEWNVLSPDGSDVWVPTLIGIVKVVPDANNSLMVVDLRV